MSQGTAPRRKEHQTASSSTRHQIVTPSKTLYYQYLSWANPNWCNCHFEFSHSVTSWKLKSQHNWKGKTAVKWMLWWLLWCVRVLSNTDIKSMSFPPCVLCQAGWKGLQCANVGTSSYWGVISWHLFHARAWQSSYEIQQSQGGGVEELHRERCVASCKVPGVDARVGLVLLQLSAWSAHEPF